MGSKKKPLKIPPEDPKLIHKTSALIIHKPGQKAPESGQYAVVGPKGGKTGTEVTVSKGETLPPTSKAGQGFVLVDKTKHKDDK